MVDAQERQTQQHSASTSGRTAKDVVTEFYDHYNSGNVEGVMALMADNCEYHDMIYQEPFRGKQEVRAFFDKVTSIVPPDLKFVIEDISGGDSRFVGLRWHVELNGHEFPFSRGCSFYEVNEQGLIVKGRDLVEQAVKPGTAALQALRVLAPVMRKLGPNANPANLKELPIRAVAAWAFYAGYLWYIMASSLAPGAPVWHTSLETLSQVFHESLNFFYVNIGLNRLGIHFIPDIAEHPTSEALFNFVIAWAMMFLPLMLTDKKGANMSRKTKLGLWVGNMFLTNVFFVPYLALREQLGRPRSSPTGAQQDSEASSSSSAAGSAQRGGISRPLPGFSSLIGWTGLAVGAISVAWFFVGRPDAGGVAERLDHFVHTSLTDRVSYAFVLDAVLYTFWQALLMPDAPAKYRFVPFVGQAAWLIVGPKKQAQD